jgi:hypothetical protein
MKPEGTISEAVKDPTSQIPQPAAVKHDPGRKDEQCLIVPELLMAVAIPLIARRQSELLMAAMSGAWIGSINIASIWAALGTGRNGPRQAKMAAWTTLAWLLFVGTGFAVERHSGERSLGTPLYLGAIFAVAFFGVQFPFWVLRTIGGIRLGDERDACQLDRRQPWQYGLRQMLCVMLVVSIVLAVFRLFLAQVKDYAESVTIWRHAYFTVTILVCPAIASMLAVWAAFIEKRRVPGVLLACFVWIAFVGVLEQYAWSLISRSQQHLRMTICMWYINAALFGIVYFSFLMLRMRGMRFVACVSESHPPSAQ